MNFTEKLGLKKPESTDVFDIEDFNYNADILDSSVGGSGSAVGVAYGATQGNVVNAVVGVATEVPTLISESEV